MKENRLNLRKPTIFTATILLLFIMFSGLILIKTIQFDAVSFVSGLLMLVLVANIVLIIRMAQTGRVKAKGAKKRRKRLLPVFYKRKPQSAFYTSKKQ